MDHGPARIPAMIAVLRRALAHRAVRRLLVLAGLVTTGWLIGGAGQALADTAGPSSTTPRGVVVAGPAGLLHASGGIVRDASAALGGRTPVPPALARLPHAEPVAPPSAPGPGRPAVTVIVPPPSSEQPGQDAHDRPPAPLGARSGGVVSPGRSGRKAQAAASRAISRRVADAVARTVRGHVRRSAPRTVWHTPDAPAAPAPVPAPAPAQVTGSSVPTAGPTLFGGLGGALLRRSWTPHPTGVALLRAPGEVPPAVHGAADEPSFAPD